MILNFGEMERDGTFTEEWERTYKRTQLVECDAITDLEPDIYSHPRCPVPGVSRADWDNLAICRKVNATYRKNSRYLWDLTSEWSTVRTTPYVPGQNPLLDPADVTVDSEISMEERYIDLDNQPCINTAGDLVQVKIPIPRTTIKVKKNVALVNGWLSGVSGVVNDSVVRFKGVPYARGTLMLWHVHLGGVEVKNDIEHFVCDLTIKHKEEGWSTPYLNVGYNELRLHPQNTGPTTKLTDPTTGKALMTKQRCLDGSSGNDGDPVPQPVFLDANGQRPRVTINVNGVDQTFIKDPLEAKDIVIINRRFLKWYDFNNKLPIR